MDAQRSAFLENACLCYSKQLRGLLMVAEAHYCGNVFLQATPFGNGL